MSIFAAISKKVGISGLFIVITAIITDTLGITGDFDLKAFVMAHQNFFIGVFAGLILAGVTKNWVVGVISAVAVIILLYAVVGQ